MWSPKALRVEAERGWTTVPRMLCALNYVGALRSWGLLIEGPPVVDLERGGGTGWSGLALVAHGPRLH